MAAAVRTLFGNPTAMPAHAPLPMQHPVLAALVWCVAFLALAVPLTLWRHRVRTQGGATPSAVPSARCAS